MTILRETKRRQRNWATSRGIAIDPSGYVLDDRDNLFLPLSATFLAALGDAGGGELQDQRNRPAKIRALHSSAVLAINVFQHWEGRSGDVLPRALGVEGSLAEVTIERQFPSGLRGTPPTLDVVLYLASGESVAIESKFTEWMTKKRTRPGEFEQKYLRADPGHWTACGLPECQRLAESIEAGDETFRYLDALQLLKHALGLRKSAGRPVSLCYLYFDYGQPSDIAESHRNEILRFAECVDDDVGFRALSYQSLFAALADSPGSDKSYIEYLEDRYF